MEKIKIIIEKGGGDMSIKDIYNPKSLKEAESIGNYLYKNYKTFAYIGGGTDVMIKINNNSMPVDYLINLRGIPELKKVKSIKEHIFIGSMNTFSDLQNIKDIEKFGAVCDCIDTMGSPQIRNIATIGGNLINAAPSADSIPALMVHHASLKISSLNRQRTVKCTDYYKYYEDNKLKKEEILTDIILTKFNGVSGFYKLGKRNSLAIARISCAVYFEVQSLKIQRFKIALGACGKLPYRVYEVENILNGKNIDSLYSDEVLEALQNSVMDKLKNRSTMPFKKEAVVGVYKHACERALNRLGEKS